MVHAEAYFACNAAMCLCALPLGGRLAGLPAPRLRRLMLSGALSGLVALAALACPALSTLALAALPFAVWVCFGRHGAQACVRCTLTTLCASLLSGGAVSWLIGTGMPTTGALALAAVLSAALYFLSVLLPTVHCDVKQVELRREGYGVILPAMLDSGNLLRDPVTGLPVLVVPARALTPLFPGEDDLHEPFALRPGFRLLSVKTAAGGGLWPMFRPDGCRLYVNGSASEAELMVAIAGPEYGGVQALVPMAALAGRQ